MKPRPVSLFTIRMKINQSTGYLYRCDIYSLSKINDRRSPGSKMHQWCEENPATFNLQLVGVSQFIFTAYPAVFMSEKNNLPPKRSSIAKMNVAAECWWCDYHTHQIRFPALCCPSCSSTAHHGLRHRIHRPRRPQRRCLRAHAQPDKPRRRDPHRQNQGRRARCVYAAISHR